MIRYLKTSLAVVLCFVGWMAAPLSAQVRRHVVVEGLTLTAADTATGVTVDLVAMDRYGDLLLRLTARQPDSNLVAAIDIPFHALHCFLAADPEEFLSRAIAVPVDEDLTSIFDPALISVLGEYFGVARRDWFDVTRYAFMFRSDATITGQVDEAGGLTVLLALREVHARLTEWWDAGSPIANPVDPGADPSGWTCQ